MSGFNSDFWYGGCTAGYQIENTLRFRGNGQYLRLPAPGTGTPSSTHTFSWWYKKTWQENANPGVVMWNRGGSGLPQTAYYIDGVGRWTYASQPAYFSNKGSLRDTAAWYHFMITRDGSTVRMYQNGVELTPLNTSTYPGSQANAAFGNYQVYIGCLTDSSGNPNAFFDGYMAEIHAINGVAHFPDTFGEFNDSGVWVPKKVSGLTYGTNGFYLDFSDPANIGADRSGNGNNFTPTGFELTSTGSKNYDWVTDSPTDNFGTFNALKIIQNSGNDNEGDYLISGNLISNMTRTNGDGNYTTTITVPSTGKWYWEVQQPTAGTPNPFISTGIVDYPDVWNSSDKAHYSANGSIQKIGTNSATYSAASWGAGYGSASDVIGVAVDCDGGSVQFYKNGVANSNTLTISPSDFTYIPYCSTAANTSQEARFNFGQQPFAYTKPAGYSALSTSDMPKVTVPVPSEGFQTIIGEGPESTVGFPDSLVYGPVASTSPITAIYGKEVQDANINSSYPVFQWADSAVINGYNDWYIPAVYELDTLYYNLKPTTDASIPSDTRDTYNKNLYKVPQRTIDYGGAQDPSQTTAAAFQEGGDEAFLTSNDGIASYYTVSQHGQLFSPPNTDPSFICFVKFLNGDMWANGKQNSLTAWRLIRREPYTGNEPSIGEPYRGGYFGGLYSVNGNGTPTHALIVAPNRFGTYGWVGGILNAAQATFPNGLWWIKDRQNSNQHQLVDSVRGSNQSLNCPNVLTQTYVAPTGNSVAWCWSTNDSGVNVDTGFQMINYTGDSNNGRAISHSLGTVPGMVIVKPVGQVAGVDWGWLVQYAGNTSTANLSLNATILPTVSVHGGINPLNSTTSFSLYQGSSSFNNVNATGGDYMAYVWAPVPAYSAFGTYTGNGNGTANYYEGPFIYTGFKPLFVMIKVISGGTAGFYMLDTKRNLYNPMATWLYANQVDSEVAADASIYGIDFVSNGFKLRTQNSPVNNNGWNYFYAAFAEHPFGGSNCGLAPAKGR